MRNMSNHKDSRPPPGGATLKNFQSGELQHCKTAKSFENYELQHCTTHF